MAAYCNGGELTVEQYLYAAQELAKNADEQVAILTAASKKFNDARVWNNLGVAQTQAGDKAAALKSFEKAAKLDSSKELNKNLLLANLANNNTAEAKSTLLPPTLRPRLPWLPPRVTTRLPPKGSKATTRLSPWFSRTTWPVPRRPSPRTTRPTPTTCVP